MVVNKEYITSIEAGIKYYIFGAIVSFLFLLGISLIYGMTGTTVLYKIYFLQTSLLENNKSYYIFLVFLLFICLFLFKIGIYPFNYWVTNFYEGASWNIVFFISIVPKLPYLYIFIVLFQYVFDTNEIFSFYMVNFLIMLSFVTIIVSVIEGLLDNNINRLFGQSSMINMSFIFIVLLLLVIYEDFYLFYIYIFYLIPTFIFCFMLSFKDQYYFNNNNDISLFSFISCKSEVLFVLLYTIFVSLSGLPFFCGFISK
jgi:NADH:ubiquinone oxidoreductase subunit 2 (subunit N)